MFIKGMYGLGDNIYQRAFIRELTGEIYLDTPWPQIYSDLSNVRPVAINTKLRTHAKNIASQAPEIWHQAPVKVDKRIQYQHGERSLMNTSILEAMKHCLGVKPKIFDLPKFTSPKIDSPYAVVRPVTLRSEWMNSARNPKAEYISSAAQIIRSHGVKVVSLADLKDCVEWADELPVSDLAYNHGELSLEEALGLIQGASLVVGGVGWIVPAAIASGVPLITILGGQGRLNAPEKISGAPMDLSRVRWIKPDKFCNCANRSHKCDKFISDFEFKFEQEMANLCSPLLAI